LPLPARLVVDSSAAPRGLPPFPTRRSSDLGGLGHGEQVHRHPPRAASRAATASVTSARVSICACARPSAAPRPARRSAPAPRSRSEEHTSELQSRENLVCRLLLEKKNTTTR